MAVGFVMAQHGSEGMTVGTPTRCRTMTGVAAWSQAELRLCRSRRSSSSIYVAAAARGARRTHSGFHANNVFSPTGAMV
jgi:hypothetical protein